MGYTKATMKECAIPWNFETYLHIPNAADGSTRGCRSPQRLETGVALLPNLDHAP